MRAETRLPEPEVARALDTRGALRQLAASLEYPAADASFVAAEAADHWELLDAELAGALRALARSLADAPPGEAAERYTALFDLSPVCTLHLGYHLFGEAYQRGALLAGLTVELRKANVDLGDELPDFLPTLLRLVAELPEGRDPDGDRETLVDAVLLPALSRMIEALGASTSAWAAVVRALPAALAPLGGGRPVEPPPRLDDSSLEAEADA